LTDDDILQMLVRNAEQLLATDYYDTVASDQNVRPRRSLVKALCSSINYPIVAEVKMASPSNDEISNHDPDVLISKYIKGGASALSVLTEPNFFKGSLQLLGRASSHPIPVLMKDFIISKEQIDAAATYGASVILLIQRLFTARMVGTDRDQLIDYAHKQGLEVLLEAADEGELWECLSSSADVIGINQRDLRTMTIEPGMGARIMNGLPHKTRPIIVMSGIATREQVIETYQSGAAGVLIGTELASSADPELKLKELVVPR
jgi:indole-3-glycerol phosphate synthase